VILPPPVTSDCTLDDVEAYLDRMNALKRAKSGGTETGAPCAGDEEKPSDAGQQE